MKEGQVLKQVQLVLKQVQLVRRFAASMALLDGTQKQVQLVLEQVQWVRRFAASLSLAASLLAALVTFCNSFLFPPSRVKSKALTLVILVDLLQHVSCQ